MLRVNRSLSSFHPYLKRLVVLQMLWMLLVGAIISWWGTFLLKQAIKIRELEVLLGIAAHESSEQWQRTHRMLIWEFGTLIVMVLSLSGALIWLYWRDELRSRGLQSFFASVTHELRTPLTSIRLQAESIGDLALNLPGTNKQLLSWVERLLEDTARLESQVTQTLELARTEGGGELHSTSVDLRQFCEELSRYATESYKNRLDLKYSLAQGLVPCVQADAAALLIIFKNLFENSLKHSAESRVLANIKIDRSESHPRARWTLRYSDSGKNDTRVVKPARLFERGADSQGSGVGLYLVATLVKKMGGTIHFIQGPGFPIEIELPPAGPDSKVGEAP